MTRLRAPVDGRDVDDDEPDPLRPGGPPAGGMVVGTGEVTLAPAGVVVTAVSAGDVRKLANNTAPKTVAIRMGRDRRMFERPQ